MLRKIISDKSIDRCKQLIAEHNKITLITHITPDGDALGSTLGIYWLLKGLGKDVEVVVPNEFPLFLSWLKGSNNIMKFSDQEQNCIERIMQSELLFFLDFNTMGRIGGIKKYAIDSPAKKILIDHHPQPNICCDVNVSHPEISSTSELVFRLIYRMEYFEKLSLESAECIYTGMMTDTGNFSFNSQNADIYLIIYQLMQKGINKDEIYQNVFHTYSEDRIRLMGYCLSEKMKIYSEQRTALIVLTIDELERFNYQIGDTEGFVNIPLQMNDVDISIFLKEDSDKIKISFRSVGSYPVNNMAKEFNGGGHLNAAGGESYKSVKQTVSKLEEVIRNRDKYQNIGKTEVSEHNHKL